ncbi:NatC N-acetyltransferase complex subunit Mak10 [Schizosaccharomyces japonicus yFS275]|uniref:NatC N-acetyltransferase complex subunit Mak10 n=1 Tax=Schizosaccharomyces japonicus (strain yFS275 / FY16936) TaxID=402676 RepID=B6K3M5_SCHJY|nr:NatC N-acetyltransferase complex subunit Mak10 [Schizosaccharomyces japonicus yFS275]EEB08082.2 NatC N-acetyltransferase complex subunit Mak10 [Schizosaccharomyces japonicus yFS275]
MENYQTGPSDIVNKLSSQYIDCTEEYKNAVSTLYKEELVQYSEFTLLDSISAFEIMDEKMDSGLNYMSKDLDLSKDLSALEVIATMDGILRDECDWHKGTPMSESLFTNLLLLKVCRAPLKSLREHSCFSDCPDTALLNSVIFPYIVATIKCCDLVRREYLSGKLYDEEDTSASSYQISLLETFPAEEADKLLVNSIACLDGSLQKYTEETRTYADHIRLRLNIRLLLLRVYQRLEFDIMEHGFSDIYPLLKELLQSHEEYAASIMDTVYEKYWDFSIQAQLPATAPPRRIPRLSFSEVVLFLEEFCSDGMLLSKVRFIDTPISLFHYFLEFSKLDRLPEAYIRSSLQSIVMNGDLVCERDTPQSFFIKLLFNFYGNSLNLNFLSSSAFYSSITLPLAQSLQDTVLRLANSVIDILRLCSHNPCRQRRNAINILTDFDFRHYDSLLVEKQLSIEAPDVASRVGSFLSSFALHLQLSLMEFILVSGFEQELFLLSQADIYFSYLRDLYVSHYRLVKTLRSTFNLYDSASSYLSFLEHEYSTLISFAEGYLKMTCLLITINAIPKKTLRNEDEFQKSQFLTHFRPFLQLRSLPPLSLSVLKENSKPCVEDVLIKEAKEHFNAAKKNFLLVAKQFSSVLKDESVVDLYNNRLKKHISCCIANVLTLDLYSQNRDLKIIIEHKYDPGMYNISIKK